VGSRRRQYTRASAAAWGDGEAPADVKQGFGQPGSASAPQLNSSLNRNAQRGLMARDYDSQLLESVAVRRRRMRDALLFGPQRVRRTADERLGKVFAGIAIVAVLCAGCVGWSFIKHTLDKQKAEQKKQEQQWNRTRSAPSSHQVSAAPERIPDLRSVM
jgi:hypothetical protein